MSFVFERMGSALFLDREEWGATSFFDDKVYLALL